MSTRPFIVAIDPGSKKIMALRMSEEEFKAFKEKRTPAPKVNKYRNIKTIVNGLEFQSIKEARRYQDLLKQQKAGQITELERQRSFDIEVNGQYIGCYVSDFCFKRDGVLIVEDVKSTASRKIPVYVLKKKLVFAVWGIVIQEI